MGNDLQIEFAILTAMSQFTIGRAAQRNTTQDKRASVIRQLLLPILPLLSDELNRV